MILNVFYVKRLVWLVITLVMLSSLLKGQGKSVTSTYKELAIGEKMPDISLGTVINNVTGKTKFSDFKGKLVILDFWNINCSSCIAGFPHMSDLQRKFGDKIQIFLVNTIETEAEIKKGIELRPYWRNRKDLFPANLPILANARELGRLFPTRVGVPYHVWIDKDGIVRLRGSYMNTNEEKIKDILAGKKISFVKDDNGDFNADIVPLYAAFSTTATPALVFNSLLTRYNDTLGKSYGGPIIWNKRDSISRTIRNTFINVTVVTLYYNSIKEMLRQEKNLLTKNEYARVVLLVKDTLRYTDDKEFYAEKPTDKTFTQCRFCYEQVTPIDLPDASRKQLILQDLNRYFDALYGTEGRIEKRRVPCWILVRTSKTDKLKHTFKSGDRSQEFKEAMSDFFTILPKATDNILSEMDIVVDETGYAGKVDIAFPGWPNLKDIGDVRRALNKYDLDIVRSERELKMLVIEEKK